MMKKTVKILSLLMIAALLATLLAACGGSGTKTESGNSGVSEPAPAPAEPDEGGDTAEEPENYLDVSGVDFSNPSVVIAAGDYDGMESLAKKMQNFEIEAGTVVEIYGEVGASMMSHTVVVPNADHSQRIGTTFEVVGMDDAAVPGDETPIHLVGVVRMNGYFFNVLVVPAEHFEVLAD